MTNVLGCRLILRNHSSQEAFPLNEELQIQTTIFSIETARRCFPGRLRDRTRWFYIPVCSALLSNRKLSHIPRRAAGYSVLCRRNLFRFCVVSRQRDVVVRNVAFSN